MFTKDDIVKVSREGYVTIAKVLASTEASVLIYRDTGNIWLELDEYQVEKLGA